MQKYLLILLALISTAVAFAHEDTAYSTLRLSKVENAQALGKFIHVYVDTFRTKEPNQLTSRMFRHLHEIKNGEISKKYLIDGNIYMLLWVYNDLPETKSYFLTASTYSKNIQLYIRNNSDEAWKQLPYELPGDGELAYSLLHLDSLKEVQLLIRANFAKTGVAQLRPFLIEKRFYKYHVNYLHTHWFGLHLVTYIISGVLLMMLLFSFFTFLQNHKREFLYYSIYALCVALMLFLKAMYHNSSAAFNFLNEEYLDYALQMIGYVFYIGFTRMFLNTPREYPVLNRIFIASEILLVFFLLLFTWLFFTGKSFVWLNGAENMSKFFMIFLGIVYVVIGLTYRNKLMNYLVAGNIANLIFAGISQAIIVIRFASFIPSTGLFRQSLFYFEIGIFLELVFFLLGLVYKNKAELIEKTKMEALMKQEAERQEYEKQIAVLKAQQDERTRISADMHDELGSGVTAIRLLSEIALQKTKEQPVEEIARISNNANDLMSKMNGIIWSMNPGNDTLSSTIAYMRSNASEYLDNFKINYDISVPDSIPDHELSGNKRRNLFLVLKESLNNIIKHSGATHVHLQFTCNKEMLHIAVSDNGKGIDAQKLNEYGNGLKNMQRRMTNIGGSFSITSQNGTTVSFELPLIS